MNFKRYIFWCNFMDGKDCYSIFKKRKDMLQHNKITYVRFDENGVCNYRWATHDEEYERKVYNDWIKEGYKEIKDFEEKRYVGTL